MKETQTVAQDLLNLPFTHGTDFTELAGHCEQFAQTLVECDNTAEKLALCGRLSACLALLQPTLNEPVPDELMDALTINDLPETLPAFEPEGDQLAHYCQSLTQLLLSRSLPVEMTCAMEDLLCELVNYLSAMMKAPRWINTPEGRVLIDDILH
ncbi:hypothetical protein EGM70_03745 [Enterobacteriaceae bacterium 89]|nr:hypothetical protein [Enterobacteriaceae bacterium 89]